MDITILTTGENHKEFRIQVQTSEGAKHHLTIKKPHPDNLTAAQFQTWLMEQIGKELSALSKQALISDTVLTSLVGQTVPITLPSS